MEKLVNNNWKELDLLLEQYNDVFSEQDGLPPPREQDHQILLKENAQPINLKPYDMVVYKKM